MGSIRGRGGASGVGLGGGEHQGLGRSIRGRGGWWGASGEGAGGGEYQG